MLIAGSKTVVWKLFKSFCTFPITKFIVTACGNEIKETESGHDFFGDLGKLYRGTNRLLKLEIGIRRKIEPPENQIPITLNRPPQHYFRPSSSSFSSRFSSRLLFKKKKKEKEIWGWIEKFRLHLDKKWTGRYISG